MSRTLIALAALCVATGAQAQQMELSPNGSRAGMPGPSATFTGSVYVEPMFPARDAFAVSGGKVTFMPGARSHWHTHPIGQVLVVTDGTGWVQEDGQRKHVMRPGDVVWCPPGVKHWHGATDTTAVTHTALTGVEGGSAVTWMEPVTDAQFLGGAE